MVSRAARTTKIVLGGVLSVAAIVVFGWLPPFLSFAVAVASASCWCYWLEQHQLTPSESGASAAKCARG